MRTQPSGTGPVQPGGVTRKSPACVPVVRQARRREDVRPHVQASARCSTGRGPWRGWLKIQGSMDTSSQREGVQRIGVRGGAAPQQGHTEEADHGERQAQPAGGRHASQDAADERQQLVQRVEVLPSARRPHARRVRPKTAGPRGLGAQLHHKGPIGRERQGELGHRRPPATPRRGGAFSRCSWHARKIQYAIRFRPEPKRSNWGVRCQGSVSKLCKLQQREVRWHPSTRAPLGPFRLKGTPGRLWRGGAGAGPVLVPLVAFVYQRTDGNALFMCSRGCGAAVSRRDPGHGRCGW